MSARLWVYTGHDKGETNYFANDSLGIPACVKQSLELEILQQVINYAKLSVCQLAHQFHDWSTIDVYTNEIKIFYSTLHKNKLKAHIFEHCLCM